MTQHLHPPHYIGRFAPSPTGPLHLGSLIGALASFLDARANRGQWLLRIDDIDQPRTVPGAARAIMDTLSAHGLQWDGEVLWQSQQQQHYQRAIEYLLDHAHAYYCCCSRADVQAMGGIYDGRCRNCRQKPGGEFAIRVQVNNAAVGHSDFIQGDYSQQLETDVGDFVVLRKDGLFAYQLAVVVDDALQQITHVVRGSDLLDSTPRQLYLQQLLGYPSPCYAHFPVISNDQGQKLSKQTHAPAVSATMAGSNLRTALHFLNQPPPPQASNSVDSILHWAIEHWNLSAIPQCLQIQQSTLPHIASHFAS